MRLFLLALSMLLPLSAGAATPPPVTYPISIPNGGSGQVAGLVFNSTSAAAANATAINTALAAGGKVNIDCPAANSIIYINAPLVVYSQSEFHIGANCVPTASVPMSPMLTNYAFATEAWTTLYDSSGVITNGPLSVIREADTPYWIASHAYAKGNYVNSNGNIYWCATAGTSASSGGVTGTGSGITDGTVVWNYVTTFTAYNYTYPTNFLDNNGVLAVVHIPAHGLTIGKPVWITPAGDAPTATNGTKYGWSGTQAAQASGGPLDDGYMGVFPVVAVNDANYVTVMLRRGPALAFSGVPILYKVADQNITIDSPAIWNYNYPTNNRGGNTGGVVPGYNLNLAGILGLTVKSYTAKNTYGFSVDYNALEMFDIGHITVINAYADAVKGYGPLFDGTIHDVVGSSYTYPTNGDDFCSYNTEDYDYTRTISVGDILNVKMDNIVSYGGLRVGAWMQQPYLYMDNLDFGRIQSATPYYEQGTGIVTIYNPNTPSATAGGNIGTIRVHDISARGGNPQGGSASAIVGMYSPGTTIAQLSLQNIDVGQNISYFTAVPVTAGTVSSLVISGASGSLGLNGALVSVASGATITNTVVENSNVAASQSTAGIFANATGSADTEVTLSNNQFTGSFGSLVNDYLGSKITLVNNYIPNSTNSAIYETVAGKIFVENNYLPNSTFGLMYSGGTNMAPTVTSAGGNNFGSSANWFTGNATLPIMYGWDIKCNVAAATRATGEYCLNTNVAPGSGTLTTSGLVIDQGTTAPTWFLLSNPTGQSY